MVIFLAVRISNLYKKKTSIDHLLIYILFNYEVLMLTALYFSAVPAKNESCL